MKISFLSDTIYPYNKGGKETRSRPEVSIVILTRNAGPRFNSVLSNIFSQSYKNFEVIIIDSESTDSTLASAKQYNVKIVRIKAKNFKHGKIRNLGARLAKGKYVIFLTHDAIPKDKNWLSELIKPFNNRKIAGVYSRQVPRKNENEIDKFFYFALYPSKSILWTKNNNSQGDNIFSDVSSAIRKNLLLKYPFDNDIIVTEDYEWAGKMLRKGYKIYYSSKSQVIHSHSYKIGPLFKRCFDIGVSYRTIYINKDKNSGFIQKGLKIQKQEIKYLIKNKSAHLVPYAMLKDLVKLVGVTLGKKSNLLPNSINRRFSNYPRYWK